MIPSQHLSLSPEVAAALERKAPVVALESSIIAHGFPHPENLALAEALEGAVRAAGALPAMIALLDGRIHVGLNEAEVRRLCTTPRIPKCSTRDLGPLVALGQSAGTTVAATANIACRVGIRVFATGGIGGVHRRFGDVDAPADVSADLLELSRTPIAVVTSGAKSILDLPATLETLETYGVGLIGFRTTEFPAFHTPTSGLPLAFATDDPAELARTVRAHLDLGLPGALLVCNPPPADLAIPPVELEGWIAKALGEAEAAGIRGGAVTPYLLGALNRLSGGRSVRVNRGLAIGNAELAARIAAAL